MIKLGFEFHHPWMLWVWAILPILVILYFRSQKRPIATLNLSVVAIVKKVPPGLKVRLRHLPFWLRLMALAFLILALAGPRMGVVSRDAQSMGIDIFMTFDISGSMQALDLATPSERKEISKTDPADYFKNGAPHMRLNIAKKVMVNFIQNRPFDRLGLVIFAGMARTACPLTLDHNTLSESIRALDFSSISTDGTAIGDALMTSIARLKDSGTKTKILILLSDGSNNAGQMPPLQAAKVAKSLGIKIYTIGIGRKVGTTLVPVQGFFGGGWQETPLNPEQRADDALMQNIAQSTGGQYFSAQDSKELATIYNTIDKLEKSKINAKSFTQYTEFFPYWILVSAILLFIEMLLSRTWLRRLP